MTVGEDRTRPESGTSTGHMLEIAILSTVSALALAGLVINF